VLPGRIPAGSVAILSNFATVLAGSSDVRTLPGKTKREVVEVNARSASVGPQKARPDGFAPHINAN
jgi:hypothetical protein